MDKRKFARIGALATTAVATAALLGSVVATTGAYFTDGHAGQIAGNNGTVAISVAGSGATSAGDPANVAFDFSGILPGTPKTATITVTNPTTNPEAIWLVFDNSNSMWSAVNNLGQYGKFTVGSFVYDNLSNKYVAANPGVVGTPIPGSYMSGSCSTVQRIPVNYLPHAVNLGTLGAGATFNFSMSFTYNACMTNHQGEALFNPAENDILRAPGAPDGGSADIYPITPGPLLFKVAAFQDGVDATSPFNGANAITPLNLSPFGPSSNQ